VHSNELKFTSGDHKGRVVSAGIAISLMTDRSTSFAVLMSVTGPKFLEQSPMPSELTKADIEFGAVKEVDLSVIKEIAMPVDTTLAV